MAALNAGITLPGQGDRGTFWNILGQTYYLKEICDTSFAFEVVGEPGTFVPAHVHPTQDDFIYLAEVLGDNAGPEAVARVGSNGEDRLLIAVERVGVETQFFVPEQFIELLEYRPLDF